MKVSAKVSWIVDLDIEVEPDISDIDLDEAIFDAAEQILQNNTIKPIVKEKFFNKDERGLECKVIY